MEELLSVINNNQTIRHMLKHCPYTILSQMELVFFKARKFQLHQVMKHSDVYIVVSGKVKIFVADENGRQILLDIYQSGNLIGEQEAFLDMPYSASIENTTDCLLIKVPNQSFIEWVALDHHFNQDLIYSLCEQMYELTNRAAKYSLGSVKEQVITTLLDLEKKGKGIDKKLLVQSVSATSRSVYRILSELETLDIIRVEPKSITIINQQKLLLERKKD